MDKTSIKQLQVAGPLRMSTAKRIMWKTGPIWRSDVIFNFRCYYTVILSLHFVTLYNNMTGKEWNAYVYIIYIYISMYPSIYLSLYILIYICIYYKIYVMKAMRSFVVMNATAWRVKVANMFVVLITWCKIQEKNYCKLHFI